MRIASVTLPLVATLVLAGCASAPQVAESEPAASAEAQPAPPAPAPADAPAAAALANTAAPEDDPIICRKEKPLGTRIGKMVCRKKSDIDALEATAETMMKDGDRKSGAMTFDPRNGGG